MRPTAGDALDGAERLLRALVADGALAHGDAEPVLLLLRQARTGAVRLPFLDEDNRRLLALLSDLRPHLPEDVASEVAARALLAPDEPVLDVVEADLLNVALRDLLARGVRSGPGAAALEQVRGYLLERLEREPA